MKFTNLIAKNCRELYFGNNWTASNLKSQLSDVTFEEATEKIGSFNSIATLTFHINYYIVAAQKVFDGQILDSRDELSFNHPPIHSQHDWEGYLEEVWRKANKFISSIESLPDDILVEPFSDEKYGNYYRNIQGIIEHGHYHLGQIVIIKKLLRGKIDMKEGD